MRVTQLFCDRCEEKVSELVELEIKVFGINRDDVKKAFMGTPVQYKKASSNSFFGVELCLRCFDRLTRSLVRSEGTSDES